MEPTDEMVRAYWDACPAEVVGEVEDVRVGLTAVLAIVERDHCLAPAGHALATKSGHRDGCTCMNCGLARVRGEL